MADYIELINRLRQEAEFEAYLQPHSANETPKLLSDAADAIEELSKKKDCPYWFEDGGFCNMLGKCIVEPTKEES